MPALSIQLVGGPASDLMPSITAWIDDIPYRTIRHMSYVCVSIDVPSGRQNIPNTVIFEALLEHGGMILLVRELLEMALNLNWLEGLGHFVHTNRTTA